MNRSIGAVLIALFIVAIVVGNSVYVVREDKQVIMTRFGKPVRDPVTDSGLHFKLPFLEKVNQFEPTLCV